MSGFSAEWLALREPADQAARSVEVTQFITDVLATRGPVTIVDLGTGTGANVRYLAPRLTGRQHWRLVDNDAQLLARAAATLPGADPLESDLRTLAPAWFNGADLVTASALLDLVSERWLDNLVECCRRERALVLAALNYDGRIDCTPADEDDGLVRDLVNRHQRTDKGFGPALGPQSGRAAEALLTEAGYEVRRASSEWVLESDRAALQRELVAGWAAAASELRDDLDARIQGWKQRRLAHIVSGTSRIIVGHDDVAGVVR